MGSISVEVSSFAEFFLYSMYVYLLVREILVYGHIFHLKSFLFQEVDYVIKIYCFKKLFHTLYAV